MSSEILFKIAFIAAFVVVATGGTIAAKRASRAHGSTVNQIENEVPGLIAIRSALGVIFYGMLMMWLFWPSLLSFTYLPLPGVARWSGVVLLVPALWLLLASFSAMGTSYRGGVGLYDKHELVTSGPYRMIRHPIYVGFILVMLAVALISANWLMGLAGIALVTTIPARRIRIEEAQLRERFGDAWDSYASRTSMLFPGL